MSSHSKPGLGLRTAMVLLGLVIVYIVFSNKKSGSPIPTGKGQTAASIAARLTPPTSQPHKDGLAVIILLDSSGSMADAVPGSDGKQRPKIEIARQCVAKVVKQIEGFAADNSQQPTLLGIYEFSMLDNQPAARKVLPLNAPSLADATKALKRIQPNGGTPIGEAMIQAKLDLDATALSRCHLLVVTDGQNTDGASPGQVMAAISALPVEQRPGVYFVAFDVAASVFKPVRDAGAMVLPAANEKELQQALDELVGNKILLEK